ncbi:MAG: GIDE domain-containing protein [Desulfuromonadales bacterium]|nr:GIDE domain-containing protein [Desulfuromonadales bacterium]
MGQETLLIVKQQPHPEGLDALLSRLAKEHGMDAYACRQRLTGQGLALLESGPRDSLELLSSLLQEAQVRHWLAKPTTPEFSPAQIRSLKQTDDGVVFTCQKKRVKLRKGTAVLAVLADLSGQLADRSARQLISSYTYQGKDHITRLSEEKIYKTIMENKPVLDLYLLDESKRIVDAVRVVPGKFDHKGLAERATLSSRRNLHEMIRLCRKQAGEFQLETGLGLSALPGCALESLVDDNIDILRKNLKALTRYGWLMADLQQQGEVPLQRQEETSLSGSLAAALLARNPALAGSQDLAGAMPFVGEIAAEIHRATAAETAPSARPATRSLPAPPEQVSVRRNWLSPKVWLGSIGGLLTASVLILLGTTEAILPAMIHYGFEVGVFPALFAALMFWGGFHYLHLKRQVENTPTSKIRSVAMGMVEVKGKAIRQYALVSPKTNIACAWYRLTNYRREGNKNWVISSVTSSESVPFLLEDETGRITIDPAGATIRPGHSNEGFSNRNSISLAADYSDRSGSEKWVEEIICEGTSLYILGCASVKKQQGQSLQEKQREALLDLKRAPAAMKRFDTDNDGQISQSEWEEARASVEDQVLEQSLGGNDRRRRQEERIVIGKPAGRRPFIIAETHSETRLTRSFAYYAVPLFVGATLCTAWAISLLFG